MITFLRENFLCNGCVGKVTVQARESSESKTAMPYHVPCLMHEKKVFRISAETEEGFKSVSTYVGPRYLNAPAQAQELASRQRNIIPYILPTFNHSPPG